MNDRSAWGWAFYGNKKPGWSFSILARGTASPERHMKAFVIALVASSALAFGAQAQSSGTSPQNQGSTTPTPSNQGSATATQSGASRSDSVNVRANIRTGGDRTTVRTRSDSPSVVYRSSRTRHIATYDERPSS